MPLDGRFQRKRQFARSAERPVPTVRRMDFTFDGVPRHWFGGNAFATHMSNGLHLLFPDGERFFVRSVRHYLPQLRDPALRASVEAFFGQEGSHAREHQRTYALLASHGLDVHRFLRAYRKVAFELLEPRFPPSVRLAVTAACEHFTAMFAHSALTSTDLDPVHPAIRELLLWHAAEEIEHKSVAFDVFEEVDGRYSVRALGMGMAFVILSALWTAGTVSMLRQDPEVTVARLIDDHRKMRADGKLGSLRMVRMLVEYLQPGFHPDALDDYELARTHLRDMGRLDG